MSDEIKFSVIPQRDIPRTFRGNMYDSIYTAIGKLRRGQALAVQVPDGVFLNRLQTNLRTGAKKRGFTLSIRYDRPNRIAYVSAVSRKKVTPNNYRPAKVK